MALSNCAECKENLQLKDNRIECYGFCGKKFHFSCISKTNKAYKKHVMTLLIEIPNFQWYCDDCIPHTINGTYNGILQNINSCVNILTNTVNGQQLDNGSISTFCTQSTSPANGISTVQPFQTQTQIQTQIQTGFQDSNIQNVNTADSQSNSSESVANTSTISIDMTPDELSNADFVTVNAKRKLSPSIENAKRRKSNVHFPSQGSQLGDFVAVNKTQINTTDKNENSRCIYVTPFKPTTESSEIMSHLKSFGFIREFADKINCVKLISDKVNPNKLSFVSFKIFVPDEHFNVVSDQSIWPQGISVKEFETRLKIKEKPIPKVRNLTKRNFNSNTQKNTHHPKSNFRPRPRRINQNQNRPHLNQSANSMMTYPMVNQPMFNPQMLWNLPGFQNQFQNQYHRNAHF